MGVKFIIGRAGTGKSHGCFREIVELLRADPLGDPVYWIVPRQETFTAQRQLTCESGLPGFCRARVVSFDLLGEEILTDCGGTAIPSISELGRQMIIGHLLRRHQDELKHYASTARQVGLAAELDATFSELERFGHTPAELHQLVADLPTDEPGAGALANKLADLNLLFDKYTAYVGQDRLDPRRRLVRVLECVAECKRLHGATVFIDGFIDFTDYERRMIVALAKVASSVRITLLMDPKAAVLADPHHIPDELSLFHRTEQAYRKLWFALNEADIVPTDPIALDTPRGIESAALVHVEQHLFARKPSRGKRTQDIALFEAPDRRGEVDAAARQIQALVGEGFRLRDIVVLMRDIEDYHELITASFGEHGIPFFIDRRRSAAHHPLLQFIRSALQVAVHGWPRDAVFAMLKTELAGLSREQVDELENYVLLHRIKGSAWTDEKPWQYQRKLTRSGEDSDLPPAADPDAARMDTLRRRLAERLSPLALLLNDRGPVTVRQIVLMLLETIQAFDVRSQLKHWIDSATQANHLEEAAEHSGVWTELSELLDEMTDILGDEVLSPQDFVDVLDTGLERFSLALTPPTLDQVLVGSADRTRSPRPKAAILLGMNEGQFPRVPREGSILTDTERQKVAELDLDLDPDSSRSLLDERLLGYIALTRASRKLCLIRSIADDDARPQAPSKFWVDLKALFASLQPTVILRQSKHLLDTIGTPRQYITSLMHWVRSDPDPLKLPTPFQWLYQCLATHECSDDAIDTMRYRAWRALSYRNHAKLSLPLFPSPLTASVSQMETFAACPFKHFAVYGLRLEPREEPDVTAIDLGNACHQILERLIRQMLDDRAGWEWSKLENADAIISKLADDIGQELRGDLMLSTQRNQYLLQRLERMLGDVIAAQSAANRRGKFSPWKAELEFGDHKELPALQLKTPAGNTVKLRGKIDRVDLLEDQALFAVIDYKYTGKTLALDQVEHGLALQLLTYLVVVSKNGHALAGKRLTPAAALYVKLLTQLESVKHPSDAMEPSDPKFHLQSKPRGFVNWDYRNAFDTKWESKGSDVLQLYVTAKNEIGNIGASDGAQPADFAAMLKLAEQKLKELADLIIAGTVDVEPYRIGQATPCPWCDYRSVCRFDPAINQYRHLSPSPRQDVMARAREGKP